jgi:hypothetical protein
MGNEAQVVRPHYKFVHVAKEHSCDGCENVIAKKGLALNVTGKDRFWFSEYYCGDCIVERITKIPESDLILRERLLTEYRKLPEGVF